MKIIYNEGRVVGLSQYDIYVRQLLSTNPEATPMTEREWLTSTLATNNSMILRIASGTSRGVHDYALPKNSNLCACKSVFGSLFQGEVSLDDNNMWATKVESYGDAISNTTDRHPVTPGESIDVPYKEDPAEENTELIERAEEYLKIRSALVIQPGEWDDVENPPENDITTDSSNQSSTDSEEDESTDVTDSTETPLSEDYSEEDDDEHRIHITLEGNNVITDLEVDEDPETGCKIVKLPYERQYLVTGTGEKIVLSVEGGVNVDIKVIDLDADLSDVPSKHFITGDQNSLINVLLRGTSKLKGGAGFVKTLFSEITHRGTGTITCTAQQGNVIEAQGGAVSFASGNVIIEKCKGIGVSAKYDSISSYTGTNGLVYMTAGILEIIDAESDGIVTENFRIIGGGIYVSTHYRSAARNFYGTTVYTPGSLDTFNYYWKADGYKYNRINVDTGSHIGIRVGRQERTIAFNDGGADPIIEYGSGMFSINGGTVIVDTSKAGLRSDIVTTQGYNSTNEGTFLIGSPSSGIECYGNCSLTGGQLKLTASGNGLVCAGNLDINGDTLINIIEAYNGLVGQVIKVGESGSPTIKSWTCSDGISASRLNYTYTYDSYAEFVENPNIGYTIRTYSEPADNNFYVHNGLLILNVDSVTVRSVSLPNVVIDTYRTVNYKGTGHCISCNGSYYQYHGVVKAYGQSSSTVTPIYTTDEYMVNSSSKLILTGVGVEGQTLPKSGSANCITVGTIGPGAPIAFNAGQYWKVTDSSDNMIDFGRIYYSGAVMVYSDSIIIPEESFTLSIINNAPGLVDDDNVPDDIEIDGPEPEPTPPGPEPEPPEPEPPVPEPTKAAKYLDPDFSRNGFVRVILTSKTKKDIYILLTGFVDKTIFTGEVGFPVQGQSTRPQDGDFLGPSVYPWSCPVVLTVTTDVQEAIIKGQSAKIIELEASVVLLKYRTMYLGTLHIVTWDTPLLTEDEEVLLTEDGDYLMAEKTGTVAEMWQEQEEDMIVYYVPWWDEEEENILTEKGEELWVPKNGTITEMIIDGGIL